MTDRVGENAPDGGDRSLRRAVIAVALLNLGYFTVEFAVARAIGSVSLFADSIDFLEDASVNLIIAVALGWSVANRARLGMALSAVLLLPALAMLWAIWTKFQVPVAPAPIALSLTGGGALLVNLNCGFILARYRRHPNSLTKAAFLSARNDAVANMPSSRRAWSRLLCGRRHGRTLLWAWASDL